jgi:hypothetical protein
MHCAPYFLKYHTPMRKITGAVFVSQDGVMQAPGGPEEDPQWGICAGRLDMGVFRRNYPRGRAGLSSERTLYAPVGAQSLRDFRPILAPDAPEHPIAARFNPAAKYVLSSHELTPHWHNSHRLPGLEAVRELKATQGPDLLVQGTPNCCKRAFWINSSCRPIR